VNNKWVTNEVPYEAREGMSVVRVCRSGSYSVRGIIPVVIPIVPFFLHLKILCFWIYDASVKYLGRKTGTVFFLVVNLCVLTYFINRSGEPSRSNVRLGIRQMVGSFRGKWGL
jgi:hypothetical protein